MTRHGEHEWWHMLVAGQNARDSQENARRSQERSKANQERMPSRMIYRTVHLHQKCEMRSASTLSDSLADDMLEEEAGRPSLELNNTQQIQFSRNAASATNSFRLTYD